MKTPPLILVVDDVPANLEIVQVRLESQGYDIATAVDGEDALEKAYRLEPDLIILDIMMPKLDGIAVVKILKQHPTLRFVPVILLTAKSDTKDVVQGLDAGGDDYLTKPFEQAALVARVRAMLRIKALNDVVQAQAEDLAAWNRELEERVAAQVADLERLGKLQRFLAPQVAALVAAEGSDEDLLKSHRREVTVVFCDLRGFTAFVDKTHPEEVMAVLREYHELVGELVFRHEAVLERFAGDGILILLNDPVLCPGHPGQAVRMALAIRHGLERLGAGWRSRGHDLGFGIGIAIGAATLGQIGFDRRAEYAAVGSVTNLASRLCDEARAGQIIVSDEVFRQVERDVQAVRLGALSLKGFDRFIEAYDIKSWRTTKEEVEVT